MNNEIEWKLIYRKGEVNNIGIGHGEETWETKYKNGFLIRHVYYNLSEGDEFNHIHTMTFVENKEKSTLQNNEDDIKLIWDALNRGRALIGYSDSQWEMICISISLIANQLGVKLS